MEGQAMKYRIEVIVDEESSWPLQRLTRAINDIDGIDLVTMELVQDE